MEYSGGVIAKEKIIEEMEMWTLLDGKVVEAAGIEPASASPPHTGDYMLSLSFI